MNGSTAISRVGAPLADAPGAVARQAGRRSAALLKARRSAWRALAFALALLAPLAAIAEDAAPGLTLEDAVKQALANNFSIQVESYSVPIADAAVKEAYARFDPQLWFNYSDGTNQQPQRRASETGQPLPPTIFKTASFNTGVQGQLPLGLSYQVGGNTSNSRTTYNNFADDFTSFAGASIRLPLLRGFGPAATLTTIRIARTNRSISEWDFRATVINTITNVAYAFDEVLFARARLRSALRSRELASQLYTENERRQAVGSMSDYDVLTARARIATREEAILFAERALRDAENTFKRLVSDDTSPRLLQDSPALVAPPAPAEIQVDVTADLPVALQLRPDYQQAKLSVAQSNYNYRLYRNQLLPAIDLVGNYGYNGVGDTFPSSRTEVNNRDFPAYTGGVQFSIPLTSTAERARYHSARLMRERAEMAVRQLEQDVVVRVGTAAGQIETGWKRVVADRASRQLSEQALEAELTRLRAGPGNTFFVLQQQETLANDEVREARAIADYRNALAEYDRQLGRTLERYNIDVAELGSEKSSK